MSFEWSSSIDFSIAAKNIFYGFGNVLFNDFEFNIKQEDRINKFSITLKHFCPINSWEKSEDQYYLIDKSTQEKYSFDSPSTVREKCALAFVVTPLVHTIGLILNLANRITKLILLAHLWCPSPNTYNINERLSEAGKDIARVATTPLILIGLLFASAYGATCRPYDGQKLYATLERFAYQGAYHRFILRNKEDLQNGLVGLCFQPEPRIHLFGGNMGDKDAW